MQTWGKIAAAVALLLLAGLVYYLRLDSFPNDIGSRTAYDTHLKCRACAHAFLAELDTNKDKYPQKCEKCGKAEAWPMYQCYGCGEKFAPEPEGNPPHMPVIATCPKCKGQRTGSVPVKQ